MGQIIYTTHSPFALPTDLTSIRAVCPDARTGTSTIDNRIWAGRQVDQREGLERLLFQIGAGAALLNAAPAVLVTEGSTDVALLSRLLAEALGWPTLGAPVLPGYAEAKDALAFEPHGAPVAYLFDGDVQGRKYQKDVWKALARARGVAVPAHLPPADRARVLTLEPGHDLEDYLHPELYAAAINLHLDTHQLTTARVVGKDLPDNDRPAYLKTWGARQGILPKQLSGQAVNHRGPAGDVVDVW